MTRILDAFEELLRSRSYEQLAINDIAREANTGASSIYARFRDKRSILLAVQDRLREQARSFFEELYTPDRWADTCLEEALERIARGHLSLHREHRSIIKASLIMDDRDILETISNAISFTNLKFSIMIQHHMPRLTKAAAIDAAARIIRLMTAVLHQMVIFDGVPPTGHYLSDDELVRTLVLAGLAQVSPPRSGAKKAAPKGGLP